MQERERGRWEGEKWGGVVVLYGLGSDQRVGLN